MKKTKVAVYIIAVIFIFMSGIFIGYHFSLFDSYKNKSEFSERRYDFQVRTESFNPTCEQLNRIGVSEVVKKGNDSFIVMVSMDYFVVFGFNAEPGNVPVTAWWGASRAEAMKQACNKK